VNTAVLLASSAVLDRARVALKRGRRDGFNFWWTAATALGIAFLIGQVIVWHSSPKRRHLHRQQSTSFVLLPADGGPCGTRAGRSSALVYVDVQALRLRLGPAKRTTIDVTAVFCISWMACGSI